MLKKIILSLLILLFLGTVATAGVLYATNRFVVEVLPTGAPEMYLEVGTEYVEKGAVAQFFGTVLFKEPEIVPVRIQGEVNAEKVGTYVITYTAEKWDHINFATRTVHVVDTHKPVIELVSDPNKFTFPNEAYQEEGYSAYDLYDGDITHLVQTREENGTVIYTVTDSSGNTTTVERKIRYDDPIPPVLTLKGELSLSFDAGVGSFTEPGWEATDNCDGDISHKVTVSGTVDAATPGTYTLTYTVEDSYGNIATATRTVEVKKMKPIAPTGKVIYLTFDDGPSQYTPRLLEILAKYNVKVTFFVVDTGYIHLVSQIAAEGHTVALHTASHEFSQVYASEEAYFNDLNKIKSKVVQYTGVEPTLIRFPGGSSNRVSININKGIMTRLTKLVQEQGYRYFDWNVDSDDAGSAHTAQKVFENVVSGIGSKNNSVVLQHDIKGYSVEAVEQIIQWGLANGYTFLPLTEDSPSCQHPVKN